MATFQVNLVLTPLVLEDNLRKPAAEVYYTRKNKSSAVAEMGDCLATKDMGQKVGMAAVTVLCPFSWGELGPHLTQCRLGQGPPLYQVAS